MTRLVCITNPSIVVTAPDEFVTEVGGNCWQVGGPQPLTYPKHLWRREEQLSLPSNLDEAAKDYQERIYDGEYSGHIKRYQDTFKAGAEWMAEQGEAKEGVVFDDSNFIIFEDNSFIDVCPKLGDKSFNLQDGDRVVVQIRKK